MSKKQFKFTQIPQQDIVKTQKDVNALKAETTQLKQSYANPATIVTGQIIEPPKFIKYINNPVFERNDAQWLVDGGYKIYFPWVINAYAILGNAAIDKFYMYYSSDHAVGEGGIGLATSSDLLTWTDYGKIFVDTSEGSQTETPSVVYNEKTGLFHMYYHNLGTGRFQETALATSPNGVSNWTKVGRVISVPDYEFPGDGHTGYARVYRLGDLWVAHHLMGGSTLARFGISYSKDGIAWQTDPRPFAGMTDITENGMTRRIEFSAGTPFMYKKQLWTTFVTAPYQDVDSQDKKIYVSHIADIRKPSQLHLAIDLGSTGQWDAITVQWPFVIENDGKLYMFYESKNTDSQNAIGIAICDLGGGTND